MKNKISCFFICLIWPLFHFGQDKTNKEAIEEKVYKTTVWSEKENNMFAHFVYGLTVTDKGSILAFAEARIDKSADDGAHHLVL